MSWDAAWGNALGNSFGDPVQISVGEAGHAHAVDGNLVVGQNFLLVVAESAHSNAVDGDLVFAQHAVLVVAESAHGVSCGIGMFAIPELRLVGTMSDANGLVTETGLELIVFQGTDIYSSAPVLRLPSVSVSGGQIAIRNSAFLYGDIGSDYLVVFYDPGPPANGGGPHPATVVDANA